MKLRSYFLTWVGLGMAAGIIAYIFLSLKWLLILTALMTLVVFVKPSTFFVGLTWNAKIFLIGFVFGSIRIVTHAKMIEHSKPKGFEKALECAGHITSRREYEICAEGCTTKIYRYTLEAEYFINQENKLAHANKWKIVLQTNEPFQVGSYLRAKISPFVVGKPMFESVLQPSFNRFFSYELGNAVIDEVLELEKPEESVKLSEDAKAIFYSIIKGQSVPRPLQEKFGKIGLGYLLSVSGVHISSVFAVFYCIPRFILLQPHLPIQLLCSISGLFGVGLYGLNVTKSWSMMRSCIMLIFPNILPFLLRRCKSHTVFVLSFIAILTIWPNAIMESGFQFSFVAVSALLSVRRGIIRSALAASIATFPYTMYHIGYVSIFVIPGSILVGSFFAIIVVPLAILSNMTKTYLFFEIAIKIMMYMVELFPKDYLLKISLSATSIVIWTLNLVIFALYKNRTLCIALGILSLSGINRIPSQAILISRTRSDIALLDYGTLYCTEGPFAEACMTKFCCTSVHKLPLKSLNFKGISIRLNGKNRFVSAQKDGCEILNQLQLSRAQKAAMIDLENNNQISFL